MISLSTGGARPRRLLPPFFALVVLCWVLLVFPHLYFFGYSNMDSWTLAAPAATATAPFRITAPFLGTFDGADKAWGLHWPGGPLLTSIVMPFLPHGPATYVCIYLFYWLLLCLAATALAGRLTGSPWMALCGFLLVAGDRVCFSVAWLQRYEDLGGAIAITGILALCGNWDRRPGLRTAGLFAAFFLLPLIHPVFSGLGLAWLAWLGFRTFVLRQPWRQFCIAAAGIVAGWAAFLGYYRSRPWLYVQFRNHAQQNVEITRESAPPGVHTFLIHLFGIEPTRSSTVIYLVALGAAVYLLWAFWKSRREWRDFLLRENLAIFTAIGFLCTLFLAQLSYNFIVYWGTAWPFAVALACLVAHRLMEGLPRYRRLIAGAGVVLLLLHSSYLPARTFLWYKTGFVNLRAQLRSFASGLPGEGRLFVPESLWDTYAGGNREVYMNSLPYSAGVPTQQRYAAYIGSLMRPGDVLVIDRLQSHETLIEPRQPGWKRIGHYADVYSGQAGAHGFDLTAYQKQ